MLNIIPIDENFKNLHNFSKIEEKIRKMMIFKETRTTIVVSNGRHTFYQIHFIKHNL